MLKKKLAKVGYFVVEFDGDEGRFAQTIPDYYLMIRGRESDVVDYAEKSQQKITLMDTNIREEFFKTREICYMPFYEAEISDIVRSSLDAVIDLDYYERMNLLKSVFMCHDERVQEKLKQMWFGSGCVYPMGRMGIYLSGGPDIKYPELDLLAYYFGGKPALYFGFISYYTSCLFVVMIPCLLALGCSCFLLWWYLPYYHEFETLRRTFESANTSNTSTDIDIYRTDCKDMWDCKYLSFDNYVTYAFTSTVVPVTTIFVCLWVTIFVERWKRKESELVAHWDMDDNTDEDNVRPEFIGDERKSYVTRSMEKMYPGKKSCVRKALIAPVFIVGMILILLTVCLLGVFGWVFVECAEVQGFIAPYCKLAEEADAVKYAMMGVGALVQGLVVYALNFAYALIAEKLTEWENHRTDKEFEGSLINKSFWFQLINSFTPPTWALIIEQDIIAVMMSVAAIMLVKMFADLLFETLVPNLIAECKRKNTKELLSDEHGNETFNLTFEGDITEVELPTPEDISAVISSDALEDACDPVDEYLEMMVQFGFVVFWTGICPFVPLLAWANNLLEIRFDAFKFVYQNKRGRPVAAESIGAFQSLMQLMSYIGLVVATASLFWSWRKLDEYSMIAAEYLDNLTKPGSDGTRTFMYSDETKPTQGFVKLAIIILIEHVFIGVKLFLDFAIRDEAYWVTLKKAKVLYRIESQKGTENAQSITMNALRKANRMEITEATQHIGKAMQHAGEWLKKKKDFLENQEKKEIRRRSVSAPSAPVLNPVFSADTSLPPVAE